MSTEAKSEIQNLLRPNVAGFTPYSSARDEYVGKDGFFLDANENPHGSPVEPQLNRYPDPYQRELRSQIAKMYGVDSEQIVLGNGSDELIDLLIRALIRPAVDELWITSPSYGMYEVSARLEEAQIQTIPLNEAFQLPDSIFQQQFSEKAKLCFLCSPNNPTGNLLAKESILQFLQVFPGVVAIDEAYIDFAADPQLVAEVENHDRLVVLRTFSKAWGLAAARLGVGVMSKELRTAIDSIKPPYNINALTLQCVLDAIENQSWKDTVVREIIEERSFLVQELSKLSTVKQIYPSEANFLLVQVTDAKEIYSALVERGIVVRDRSSLPGCAQCLRITVGTRVENEALLNALKEIEEL